jgi:hypothetical protein
LRVLPDLFSLPFDYNHVDGLGRARQRNIEPRLDSQVFRAGAIGPMVEFGNLASGDNLAGLRGSPWFDEGSHSALFDALAGTRAQWLQGDGRCGMVKGHGLADERALGSFKIDAHKAALEASFGKAAALMIAAMGEFIGNIIDHSQAEETGVAIFFARPGLFEFVIADRGIGVLRSLQQCPEYSRLSSEGDALAKMIEMGVSRHGSSQGRGYGFRPIFERLADMTGQLRFRSSDYALSLDGRFGDRIGRQLAQKPRLSGFFAAVVCRSPDQLKTRPRSVRNIAFQGTNAHS